MIFFSAWAVDHLKQFPCGISPCGLSFLEMLLELAGLAGDLGQITIQSLQPCSFSNEGQERGVCFEHSRQGRFSIPKCCSVAGEGGSSCIPSTVLTSKVDPAL